MAFQSSSYSFLISYRLCMADFSYRILQYIRKNSWIAFSWRSKKKKPSWKIMRISLYILVFCSKFFSSAFSTGDIWVPWYCSHLCVCFSESFFFLYKIFLLLKLLWRNMIVYTLTNVNINKTGWPVAYRGSWLLVDQENY